MNPVELIQSKRAHLTRLANQHGAEGESSALLDMEHWVPRPRGTGLKTLLDVLRASGISIKGSSFDAIALPPGQIVDFDDVEQVRRLLPEMVFIEIKTANQPRVKPGFCGFFFALTEGEILAAEALGSRHRVALYNKLTRELLVTSVAVILARTRSSTWQLSVQL